MVEKTDRLYRNIRDWVTLDELDIEINFVKENFVLSQESRSSEKLIHGIKVLMAKNYIDNLSEETRKGMLEKAEQGVFPARAPIGYLNVECNGRRGIELDSQVAPYVEKMFRWYASGRYSLQELTSRMNSELLALLQRNTKLTKSTVHQILTNPMYYGDFAWRGTLYRGGHTPIVTRELFNDVQAMLSTKGSRSPKYGKHRWAFQGLVRCGHCGCLLTAEIKKGRYVYYHCTGYKGKCPEKFVREEELSRLFGEALKRVVLPERLVDWVVQALKESHQDEKQYHEGAIALLQREYQQLQDRLDAMYVDKLDGKVGADYFELKKNEWSAQRSCLLEKIHQHENANCNYLDEGIRLLAVCQQAADLYRGQSFSEQRQILDLVLSNSIWKHNQLSVEFREPFNHLASAGVEYLSQSSQKGFDLPENKKNLPWIDAIRDFLLERGELLNGFWGAWYREPEMRSVLYQCGFTDDFLRQFVLAGVAAKPDASA